MQELTPADSNDFPEQVRARFGVLPNFFCTAPAAPGLMEELWGFAKSAYLDSPLPSLFKERLFVHLSRFCDIRYCIVRHVGFLLGEGRPSGDSDAPPQSIAQAIALLSRPIPDAEHLERSLTFLEGLKTPVPLPQPETQFEGALFDALTILFVRPKGADRPRRAIAHAVGETTFEILTAFLAFVRTAHYWTETHPALGFESDVVALMEGHPDLARLMLDTSEAEWAYSSRELRRALDDLRNTAGALRSVEDRFQALMMATSDMLYRMGPDWSEMRALEGRGLLADTTAPDSQWLVRYIPEHDRERVLAAIGRAVANKVVFELEHQVLLGNGTEGCVLSRAIPILGQDGGIIEWFGAAIDLTARKKAEDDLRAADRRKDEFLATLAHELRNPLAPLRNGLFLARRGIPADAPLKPTFEMMDRQVKMLAHLVDDLLDISRINTGKIHLRHERVRLKDVVVASIEASQPIIDAHGHAIQVESSMEQLYVEGDVDRLTQVFSNLLSNAAKYTEPGGTITLKVARESDEAIITVADTGVGISSEDMVGLFEMFSQVHAHQRHSDGGLGIGLSLVRKLVEMHGGSVGVTSAGVGQGSTFTVRLPLIG